jgi:hypothetical protein
MAAGRSWWRQGRVPALVRSYVCVFADASAHAHKSTPRHFDFILSQIKKMPI